MICVRLWRKIMLMPYWINSKFNLNLDKRDLIQLNNGFVDLTDDTRVWITPSGAALSVKY